MGFLRSLSGWLGLVVLVALWVLSSEFYGIWMRVADDAADASRVDGLRTTFFWLMPVVGVALLSAVPLTLPSPRTSVAAALLVVPVAVYATFAVGGQPATPALWGLLAGLLLAGLSRRSAGTNVAAVAARGVILASLSWLVFAVVFEFYQELTARHPTPPAFVLSAVEAVTAWTGILCAVDKAEIVLFAMRAKSSVAATWTLFCDPGTVCLFGAGLLLIVTCARRWWVSVAWLLLGGLVWLLLRIVLIFSYYLHKVLRTDYEAPLDHGAMFWSEGLHLPLLLPLALLMAAVVRWRPAPPVVVVDEVENPEERQRRWVGRLPAVLVAIGAGSLLTAAYFHEPSGERKQGRVLIDEWHCAPDDWMRQRWPQKKFDTTSTLRHYDTEWFGEDSGYNYASAYEYLSRYYTMSQAKTALTEQMLASVDVLVLKTPSRYFEDTEIAAVTRFVEDGGGLVMIGEHTTVFGSGVVLNQVAQQFDFRFRYDCLYGIGDVDKYRQVWHPGFVPHPSLQFVGRLDLAGPCSIDVGSSRGSTAMRGDGLRALDSDYTQSNFMAYPADRPDTVQGSFVVTWATDWKKGRVIAFTDSTIFANFAIFEPGKKELIRGLVEWANHRAADGFAAWKMILGLVLLGLLVWLAGSGNLLLAASGLLLGWGLGLLGCNYVHQASLPVPTAKSDHPVLRIAIDRSLCPTAEFSLSGFIKGSPEGFGIFERWLQRLTTPHSYGKPGLTWVTERQLDLAQSLQSDVMICIRPTEEISESTANAIADYVHKGGKLLVLDSAANPNSTTDALLKPFAMGLERGASLVGTTKAKGLPPIEVQDAYAVVGGSPFVRVDSRPVGSWQRHGKGLVVVVGFGARFCDANMGVSANTEKPDKGVMQAYRFQFAMMRALVKDALPTE